MSQGDLADALDVSRQAVSKWENGMGTPTPENIVAMSKLFGVSTDYILMGKDEGSQTAEKVAPTPTTEPALMSVNDGLGKRKIMQIIGIILISLGAVFSLVGLIWAVEILLFTVYMIAVGAMLLACRKHLGLLLGWFTVAYVFVFLFVLTGRLTYPFIIGFVNFSVASIFSWLILLAVVVLAVITVIVVRKKRKNK